MPSKQKSEINTDLDNPNAFKHFFGPALILRMANAIKTVHPKFNTKRFKKSLSDLNRLEMKARVQLIRDVLAQELPQKFPDALKILLDSTKSAKLTGFDIWPYTEFVQSFGLKHQSLSLNALKKLTSLFTAEWAVRPFLNQEPTKSLAFLLRCSKDSNVHVRRWASEGSRPRLPWGQRLNKFITNPELTLPILEQLKYDPELYVRKSVANHLNDISKDNPKVTLEVLKRWLSTTPEKHKVKIEWIVKHALRTLIKAGDVTALKLVGVKTNAPVKLVSFKADKNSLKVGEHFNFDMTVMSSSTKSEKLIIDYIVHYMRANGKLSPKVFKLKNILLSAKTKTSITGKHHFREVTTRKHYPGKHRIDIQINGKVVKSQVLQLK